MKDEGKYDVLNSWSTLNSAVMDMSEDELIALLEREKAGKARLRILTRILHRYSKVRGLRERLEIVKVARG